MIFQNPAETVAGVPEGVPLGARLEDKIPSFREEHLATEEGAEPAPHDPKSSRLPSCGPMIRGLR